MEPAPGGVRDDAGGQGAGSDTGATAAQRAWSELNAAIGTDWKLDCDPQWSKWLKDGARQMGGWEAWSKIATWVRDSQCFDATALRKRRDPVTLIRKSNRARYLQMAESETGTQRKGHNGHLPAERAWTLMLDLVGSSRDAPERLHDDDATNYRMRMALRACGGWKQIGMVDQFTKREVGQRWQAAYEGART